MNFTDIELPCDTADNYYKNNEKGKVDSFIYINKRWYDRIFRPNTFYILGPKGSGKTLYAAYMCAEERNGIISKSYTISVEDYGKLIKMKQDKHLDYTDYSTMWKSILLMRFLSSIESREVGFWKRAKTFDEIQKSISQYVGYDITDNSFNPTNVVSNFEVQDNVTGYIKGVLGESNAGYEAKTSATQGRKIELSSHSFTDSWTRSIDTYKNVLNNIKFNNGHYLFVDGLDVRPNNIDENEYVECIGALVRAVYDINNLMFGNMSNNDSHHIKIVALTRTDIFLNSNLVNVTSCIRDNCVELDWTYRSEGDFYTSELYKMMNQILGWDGNEGHLPVKQYFDFFVDTGSFRNGRRSKMIKADIYIQRQTRLRPRDIVAFLSLIQEQCLSCGYKNPTDSVIRSRHVRANYSKYYTNQVCSEMILQYSSEQVNSVMDFLRMINSNMSEVEFISIYNYYCNKNTGFKKTFSTHRDLIDVLYSLDVVGWIEYIMRESRSRNGSSKYRDNQGQNRIGNGKYRDSHGIDYDIIPINHYHYREVSARSETYRLPWERFDLARSTVAKTNDERYQPCFVIHNGAKHYVSN